MATTFEAMAPSDCTDCWQPFSREDAGLFLYGLIRVSLTALLSLPLWRIQH